MAHFRGSLAHYRPQLLVPAFFGERGLDGTLQLERGAVRRRFLLRRGALLAQSSNVPSEHLAQVLSDLKLLGPIEAAAAYEQAESLGIPLGTYLVSRGVLSQEALRGALEHKAREAFFDCYTWESGEAEFAPGLPLLKGGVALELGLEALHAEALASLREWHVFQEIFPAADTVFRVFREFSPPELSATQAQLLQLAERGACLNELLVWVPEGRLHAARHLLQLYRRGALSPQRSTGPRVGQSAEIADLLGLARGFLNAGKFDSALAVAGQVLEAAPVAEAHALYRDAERRLTLALCDELVDLDDRLIFEPLPRPPPASITSDDLYLYSKLRSSRSVRATLRTAAMGELAASRSVQRLMVAGLIRLGAERPASSPTRTEPFGLAPVVPGTA